MGRVVWKGLLAHKLRLALTGLAIVLGVTFITGTFVLTDTLHNTFNTLFGHIYQNVDFQVRGQAAFTDTNGGGNISRREVPESLLATVRQVHGVEYASGSVSGYAQFISPGGKAIANGGAPTIGTSFDPNPKLSSLTLAQGTAPTTPHEVVMDEATATKYHFHVGQSVRVLLVGPPQTFTVSGIVRFGNADSLIGATIAGFDLPTAQSLFNEQGKLDAINVLATPGVPKATVQHNIAAVLPPGVEVVTGQTVANDASSAINNFLGFFSTALLVFAFISLFVGAFTIANTFAIIVGQRTRELALLRVVGASRQQVFRSVLLEAAILGVVASVVGLGLGVLAAVGLEALLDGLGFSLPSGSLVFESRTVVVALLVGVVVTMVSAISPARRAVRIPPVAAMADYRDEREASTRRIVAGSIVTAVGVAVLVVGLTAPAIALVGLGAAALFIGVAMLAPLVARPLSGVLGRPLARMGVPGRLGRQNSMRSPRRTAQTASALMVGLALVSTMAVFGASLSKSLTSSVDQAVAADYIISPSSQSQQGVSASVAAAAARVPGVTTTSTVYSGPFQFQQSVSQVTAVNPNHLGETVILRVTSGTGAPALAAGNLLIDTTTADNQHLVVGDRVPVAFAQTGKSTMRIGGIFKPNQLIGSYLVSDQFFKAHFAAGTLPVAVLLRTTSSGPAQSALLAHGLSAYPNLQVQTRAQFEQSAQKKVNQLLTLVYALLALAVLIALIGIINTLMLSVFERTREIGLLRAVGMRRRQVRAMIRDEALILSVFGAVIGIVVGTVLGIAFSASLKQQGITDVVVPVVSLVVFLVLAGVLGLGAAIWPARRGARLDVLAAIAAD